ncbi:ParB/RepB/Spo0J family partition protein [Nocardia seriolae]|uniref:ParB-like N-terminal domain-containing protein n=1 Tax=Nocardia seriolae TaxID=37332 RepID=A0A0B8NQ45_9NOCA|nr:ParB N-terminal domain-containing protein [Nocardia seriolae]MTJ61709.1 chromosome partitioning protein ParB [Nocardia seriolae]MTJ75913.1 chromosome partitioning protein ParB [Nocardia seriolae]MTJ86718.1 chromosome partitioning protein ParB [Nocardia seriolae]MTK30714.1 chromosome partitioning protein ParB [Nocardia seriolae]MTK39677.1 chromosome partitioning protein ParB [Nocardia seriolae]
MSTAIDTIQEPGQTDPANQPGVNDRADSDIAPDVGETAPEAVFLPPEELVIDQNVRKSFNLGDYPEVTESIRRHGVLTPIKAHREADGTITVVDGQVRTLTALAFEVPRVPVWITPAPAVDAAEREIRRIGQQITVNDHRIGLTEGDRAAGMAQMFAFGASMTRISHDVGRKRDQVKLAVAVGGSDTARRAVDEGQLDLEQAAVIAEYEAVDDTDAVKRLLATSRAMFGYEAKRIANDRAETRQRFLESLPYAALGFGVLDAEPSDEDDRFISHKLLCTSDGGKVTAAVVHARPSDWVVYCYPTDEEVVVDSDTGTTIAPDTVDWTTKGQPNATPAEGRRHADTVRRQPIWEPTCYLRAERLDDSGLLLAADFDIADAADDIEPDQPPHGEGYAEDTVETDDEDAEAAHAAARREEAARVAAAQREEAARVAAEQREQQRLADLRRTRLNKQGQAALQARREFVTTRLLARKTVPPLAPVFIAEALADNPGLLDESDADLTAHQLLGIPRGREELLKLISTSKPSRCQVITLGLVLGAYEKRTGKDSWGHTDRGVRRYLHFLADNGHHLTPVEQAAAGDLDPATIDIDS